MYRFLFNPFCLHENSSYFLFCLNLLQHNLLGFLKLLSLIHIFQQLVRPFIMRRLKTDVLKELPDKLEHAVYAQMTDEQNKLYTANALKLQNDLEQQSDSMFKTSKIQILAELTKLRQLCCDPSLIYQNYHGGSAKLDTCIQLIENAMAGGHKILLFSQFLSLIHI